MPIGRPRIPGTEEQRAEARRAKVRANVQAFRRRQKEKKLAELVGGHQFNDHKGESSYSHQAREEVLCEQEEANASPTFLSLDPISPESSVTSEEAEPWLWAIPSEFGARIIGTTYQDTLTSILQDEYLPSHPNLKCFQYEPKKRVSICCSIWTTSATLEMGRPETKVLMEALLAASLAIVGRDQRDEDMTLQAAYVQTRALQKLRFALTRYTEGDRTISANMLSLTALTCAMSELIANQSWDNFNRHLLGVGALIFHGGVESLTTQSAQEHFYGYRAMQAPFLFMHRQRACLSSPEWIDFTWKEDLELAHHPLHSVLDIAFQILPDIVEQDMPRKWKLSCLEDRLRKAWAVVEELDGWERRLRSQDHKVVYKKRSPTWEGLHDHYFEFDLLSTAIAFSVYTAVRIHVAALIASVSEDILSRDPTADVHPELGVLEALRWSRLACQCLEFFHTGKLKLTGRIVTLWPLETAWEFFTRTQSERSMDLTTEIAWCRSTAEELASMGIPPFQWR